MKKLLLMLTIIAVLFGGIACTKTNISKENNPISNGNQTTVSKDAIENSEENTSENDAVKDDENKDEKTEGKQETSSQTNQQTKPVAKPIVKPEPKPTPKPETKPEQKPEVKPEEKPEDSILKGELDKIIEKIYSITALKLPKTGTTVVTPENSKYYLGIDTITFTEGLASEPLMGSYAHSMVLLRVEDGADIDKIKADIKNNVDPRKWICVGVEPEKVVVDNIDNLIILIVDDSSEKFHDAFLSLK